ncbi:MAG: hypothetical protein ABIQ43_01120 [Sphingomonas sp.]
MRISSALLGPFALTACNQQSPDHSAQIGNARTQVASDERIECAVAGASAFAPKCTVERTESAEGLILTMRRPDNGFRRLLVVNDGRGVIAADGAETAKVMLIGDGRIEVAIGGDRYRLPATVKGKAPK